ETEPVREPVRDEERAQGLGVAGAAAVAPGQRRAADFFVQVRAPVLEEKVRPYQEPGDGDLRALEEGHAGRVVEDGGGVGGDGSLAGVRAAHRPAALLEEHEAGGMGSGRRAETETDGECDERPGDCEQPRHRDPPPPRGAVDPRHQRRTSLYVSTTSTTQL